MGRGRRPAKDKAKPAVPRKSPGDQAATVPDLEKRRAEALEREAEALKREAEAREQLQTRDRELVEERDQRKATAEILRVISQSPSEMRPVFQAIVDSAVKLCDAAFGGLIRWDGGLMTIGAISSQTRPAERGAFEEIYPLPVTPRSRLVGLAIREKRVVQIDDVQTEPDVLSAAQNRRLVQAQGYRTFLAVPLMRGDACFGAISLWRRVVAPFSEQHIALLQTFAEQAVIAIENVRLFTELEARTKELTRSVNELT
ncbi:MAG TPA: GAF domain-containing protein, partial [Stellaceae bacterium]|nr:GAF domain-containing protein [Stellaceae bacterium]